MLIFYPLELNSSNTVLRILLRHRCMYIPQHPTPFSTWYCLAVKVLNLSRNSMSESPIKDTEMMLKCWPIPPTGTIHKWVCDASHQRSIWTGIKPNTIQAIAPLWFNIPLSGGGRWLHMPLRMTIIFAQSMVGQLFPSRRWFWTSDHCSWIWYY